MRFVFTVLTFLLLITPAAAGEPDVPTTSGGVDGLYLSAKVSGVYQQAKSSALSVSGGNTYTFSDKGDGGFGAGLAIGHDFDKTKGVPVRMEIEYMMRSQIEHKWTGDQGIFVVGPVNWVVKNKTAVDTLLVNVYYDFMKESALSPYLSAGVGGAFVESKVSYVDDIGTTPVSAKNGKTNPAWALGFGCSYDLDNHWKMDLGYRYLDAGESKVTQGTLKVTADVVIQEMVLGIRYAF